MKKIVVVAKSEFLTAIRSKGFIIGLLLMPVLMSVSIIIQVATEKHVDVTDRAFAVIDDTGRLYDIVAARAEERNQEIASGKANVQPQARFIPMRHSAETRPTDEVRLELSERVKNGTLSAFVELPAGLLSQPASSAGETRVVSDKIVYYSDKPTYEDLRNWITEVLNDEILKRRLEAAGLPLAEYRRLSTRVSSEHRGLASRTATGGIRSAVEVDKIRTFLVPIALMILLFFVVMSATPQLLNGALEEKLARISEVLLGSVSPFELMMGKLVATTAVSTILALLYVGGGLVVAGNAGYGDAVSPALFLYFLLFMLVAVFFFGSVFIAIGAACSELKDAQGLMTPAMLILLLPMFVWHPVLKHPDSTFAVVASLFPPATPMLMLMRLASHPSPPAWQVILGIALTTGCTLVGVWAAGKIFRIGILSQGKTPSLRDLIRWVRNP